MSPGELCYFQRPGFLFLESHRGLCSSGWKGRTCQPHVLHLAHEDRLYSVHTCHGKNVVCGHSWQPRFGKSSFCLGLRLPSAPSSLPQQRRLWLLAAVDTFPQCSSSGCLLRTISSALTCEQHESRLHHVTTQSLLLCVAPSQTMSCGWRM